MPHADVGEMKEMETLLCIVRLTSRPRTTVVSLSLKNLSRLKLVCTSPPGDDRIIMENLNGMMTECCTIPCTTSREPDSPSG